LYNNDWMNKHAKLDTLKPRAKSIFYMQSQRPNQASLDLTAYLEMLSEEKKLEMISENRSEVLYQPIYWYFSNIYKSAVIIIHFLGSDIEGYLPVNAFNSFWAGIACGFNKNVLLIAPSKYRAPLDYYEIMIQYRDGNHLVDEVSDWIDSSGKCLLAETTDFKENQTKEQDEEQELNLLRLGIGCEIAENERDNLLDYFIPTFSYDKAKEAKSTIIIGRKGSGKSAIYIKLADELAQDPKNYIINLKPESNELLENVDLARMYKSDSSRITFFFTVWKCVIFSQIFIDIYNRVREKTRQSTPLTEMELAIENFYEEKSKFIGLNFLGVISKISSDYLGLEGLEKPNVLEYLYQHYINPTKTILIDYFNKSPNLKYCQIIILADNLDKTWNADKDLSIQVEMISTLLEIEEKIRHEMPGLKLNLRTTLFLRKDIFEYICKSINEPDKLVTQTHEINWEDYPEKLRTLIENRFRYVLQIDGEADLDNQVWKKYFDISDKQGAHPYKIIEGIITKRPRDLLYFIGRMFESAINNNRRKASLADVRYAIENYTKFLSQNIIAEIRAVFPEVEGILSRLQEYHGEKLEYKTLRQITRDFGYDAQRTESLVEQLFDKGYMIGYDEKTNAPFADIGILKKQLHEKRLFGFIQNKVYIIAHAKYYFIKNASMKSF